MKSYVVAPPRIEPRPSRLHLSVFAVVAAALVAIVMPSFHDTVTIAGEEHSVPLGTTVSDLVDEGVLSSEPGNLLDVEGSVLIWGGGKDPIYFVNGRLSPVNRILADGDRVSVRRGSNKVEATELVRESIPIPLERRGDGPLISLENPGVVGVRGTVVGAVSDKTVTSRVIEPPQPMVVRRWVPDPGSRVVALTFDDGPWPGQTDRILDILAEHDVRAGFFMIGYLAERYPELAMRVAEEGHVIGNHTQSHKILSRESRESVREQIVEGNRALKATTGVTPEWFRPPGGALSPKVLEEAQRENLKLVMWNVDPRDWRRPGVQPMLEDLLSHIRPGSVVLLHDGGGDRRQTVQMLPLLIEELKERDYTFVTLDELKE